jgi:hypothetical protein
MPSFSARSVDPTPKVGVNVGGGASVDRGVADDRDVGVGEGAEAVDVREDFVLVGLSVAVCW